MGPHGPTGGKVEKVCEAASISLNRNTVHGDVSALSPGGVRIGSPAMTTRGCTEADFVQIATFLDRCCQIALKVQKEKGKKLADFEKGLGDDNKDLVELRKDVEAWALNSANVGRVFWVTVSNTAILVAICFHSFYPAGILFCRACSEKGGVARQQLLEGNASII